MNKLYEEAAQGGGGGIAAAEKPTSVLAAPAPAAPAAPAGGPAVQEAFWKGWINDDGTVNKNRYDHLPEELKPLRPTLDKLNTLPDILKTYAHANTLVGKKGLMPLRPDAGDAEKAEFNARIREVLGVPDDIKEYGIKRPDDIPAEYWNDEYANKMLAAIHKNNIPPAAAKELVKINEEFTRSELMRLAAEREKAEDARIAEVNKEVAKEWGNDVVGKLSEAQRGAKFLGVDENSEAFKYNAGGLAFACQRAYEHIKEARLMADETSGADTGRSAEDELRAMTTDPANKYYKPLMDENHPGHREAARIQGLLATKIAKERANRR